MIHWFAASLLIASPQASEATELLLPLPRFEATEQADGADGWTAVEVDGAAGGSAWERARARFELPDDFEAGDWMLCVGGPRLEMAATLNGQALDREKDALSTQPWFAAGPRFVLPSVALRRGANELELAFAGAGKGRGLEHGPAFLLSRRPAERLRRSAAEDQLTASIANFATLATSSRDSVLLDRIAFKFGEAGDELALAAQLDCSLVDPAHRGEIPVREIAKRRIGGVFPTVGLQLEDPKVALLRGLISASAPVLTSPLRLSDAKLTLLDVGQNGTPEDFEFVWRLRFFPAVGGPLRVVHHEKFVLVRNDVVGLFAAEGSVLGSDEAPTGLAITLRHKSRPGSQQALAGANVTCGVVGFERSGPDPSQAESMEDLVESAMAQQAKGAEALRFLASAIASEPILESVPAGLAARASAVSTLAATRRRGGWFAYAPAAGAQSAEAFWADTFSLLHFPVHERRAIEWLLSTQGASGAIRGDLPSDASDPELAGADAYAVLRACRWFRWCYDGDRFVTLVPKLARALDHADSVDLDAAIQSGGERLSPLHRSLARVAAHREFAAALDQLGSEPELAARSVQASATQVERLLKGPDQGGRWAETGFVELPDEDPRDAAVALALELLDEPRAAIAASRLGQLKSSVTEIDWRDVLVVRALLQAARASAAARTWDQLGRTTRDHLVPSSSADASYHGALFFGMLGIRRDDLGSIQMMPRLLDRQWVRTAIRLPEGTLQMQILPPNQFSDRQVIVHNDSTLDLMVTIGLPAPAGSGKRVRHGEFVHSIHEQLVNHGAKWREVLR